MRDLLDDERLNGPHTARITYRPRRHGIPVPIGDMARLVAAIRDECQFWGGAATALLPYDTSDSLLLREYRDVLPGSHIDHVWGLDNVRPRRFISGLVSGDTSGGSYIRQIAAALLDYRTQDKNGRIVLTELDRDDPWHGIYAATLGLMPSAFDAQTISASHYVPDVQLGDFLTVTTEAVTGSWDDLFGRLTSRHAYNPRILSNYELPHPARSFARNHGAYELPRPGRTREEAGSNILVVCTPGDVADHALLWNLRSAWGDWSLLPVGVPASAFRESVLTDIIATEDLGARRGWGDLFVTSHSINTEDLTALLALEPDSPVRVVAPRDVLGFGTGPGWTRAEVSVWDNGTTTIVPGPPGQAESVLAKHTLSRLARMTVVVEVPDAPLPTANDWRAEPMNWSMYAGTQTRGVSNDKRAEPLMLEWPSTLLMAEAIAHVRGLRLEESAAGVAGRVVLSAMDDVSELTNLAHEPLLTLLEDAATRTGIGWFRRQLRARGEAADEVLEFVSTDEDPRNIPFSKFRAALAGSTKAAESWLLWAEMRGLIVKGVQLRCVTCNAAQWQPLAGLAPPIVCRGCGTHMTTPFGAASRIEFSYRISERLRRLYEHDAMGHLLTFRYFHVLIGRPNSRILGMHPGIDVIDLATGQRLSDADVLILLKDGSLVPVEVKRSSGGFTTEELDKLERLAERLKSPWSAVATCEYGDAVTAEFTTLDRRGPGGYPHRLVLSYDHLLTDFPIWTLGTDPFAWAPTETDDRRHAEAQFAQRMENHDVSGSSDFMRFDLLRDGE